MDSEQKSYELAYLLSPSIPEEEILTHANKLSMLIEQTKGIVKHAETPRKRKLSYPILKERNAYFGWVTFRLEPSSVAQLEKAVKSEKLLRHLIVEEDEVEIHPQRLLRTIPSKSAPAAKEFTPQPTGENPEEKLDLEALDKKLEEILGK